MTVSELVAKLSLKVNEGDFKKGEALIGGLRSALGAIGLSVGAARVALEALVASTASAAVGASRAAQRIGVARQAFQEMAFAAESSGVSAESFEQSLKFLNRGIYGAAHGNRELTGAFYRLGVGVRDGSGHLKSADVVMTELSDRFAAMQDGPEKVALSMKLFGRSGTDIIPMLNKGSAALAEFRHEAHELGLVMSDEDVAAAKEYKLATHELHAALEGLKLTIGKALLREFAGGKKAMAEWVKANRQWIATGIHKAVEFLSAAIKRLKLILDPFVAAFKWLVSQTWLWKAAIAALAVVLAAQLGYAIKGAVASLGEMLTAVRAVTAAQVVGAAASIGAALLWAAAIAIVALAIEEFYGIFTGDRDTLGKEWSDWLDKILKINPTDSPLVKGLKYLGQTLFDIQGAFLKLADAFEHTKFGHWLQTKEKAASDKTDAFNAAVPKTKLSRKALGEERDARIPWWRQMLWMYSSEEYKRYGAGQGLKENPDVEDMPMPPVLGGGGKAPAGPVSVQFGDINVGPVQGGSVDDLKNAFGDIIDDKLRGIIDPAYEAAGAH